MRITPLLVAALLAPAPSLVLAQGAPAPIRLPKGSTGPADGLTVGGTALPSVIGSKAPLANPVFTGTVKAGGLSLAEIGVAGTTFDMKQNASDTGGGINQWEWKWGAGKSLTLAHFGADGSYLGYPLYVSQPGKDVYGNTIDQPIAKLGTNYPIQAYNIVSLAKQMTGAGINDFTTNNTSAYNASGHFFKYFTAAADNGFDVGTSALMDVAPTQKSGAGGTSVYYTESSIIRCPRKATVAALNLSYVCGQSEHNVVNLDNDYGFISALDVATPRTGMMLLVPESFDGSTPGVGYDISYGIAFGRSGDPGANGTYVRTHTALLGTPNAISPGDGRFIYATGAKAGGLIGTPTPATSPYAFAQADGAWQRGLDLTTATILGGNAVSLADGQAVALSTDGNTRMFYEAGSGKIVFTRGGVRVGSLDSNGNMTIKGTLTQNGSP